MADDDWDKEMERLDERTAKRRAKAKEQDEKAQQLIRESEERHKTDKPAEEQKGPGISPADQLGQQGEMCMDAEGEWKPPPITDAAVREWMKAQSLPVGSTRYYTDEEVYAWRHEGAIGGSPTLWIARTVLEENDPAALVAALDRLAIRDRMRAAPKTRFLIVQEDRNIQVKPWGHGPDRGE